MFLCSEGTIISCYSKPLHPDHTVNHLLEDKVSFWYIFCLFFLSSTISVAISNFCASGI